MTSTVLDRARSIATFRYVCVRLMETLARWTPTTPEMEAKVMFGRHIWDFAQMADHLGKRAFELRQPKHHVMRPVRAYDELLDEIAAARTTGDRVSAFYDGLLPGLAERFRAYAVATDKILDEPSLSIIDGIVTVLGRQQGAAAALARELNLSSGSGALLAARERAIVWIVAEAAAA